ncbi:MAG: tetratricopeptide repeat protein [Saprospirales bacterium]|nr:tetratricopeptide repeat protein [Saprospirales bacterium]
MSTRKRQLAAIVFTDIVGYSAIMNADEDQARRIRERHRSVFQECTERHDGKIIQYYGDGTLSIFQSSVEAVESCIEIQQALQQDPKIPLRIGIHTGDIILEDEEVYGDGVNVAARLESACLPGGILVSSKVHDDIKNHPGIRCKSMGKHLFKNITEPFELFAITNKGLAFPPQSEWEEAIRKAKKVAPESDKTAVGIRRTNRLLITGLAIVGAFSLLLSVVYFTQGPASERKLAAQATLVDQGYSIAVLPFANYSEDSENDYFSDGITEDILTLLSKVNGLNVISRTTMMGYKDTEKSIRDIGEELNADYVLEGSVRRQDNKVRIVAQLIDAHTDSHLWAQTYDRELTEIFEVQSQVAMDIASALKMQLSPAQQVNLDKKGTANVEAYDLYLQGRKYYFEYTAKDNEVAIQLFQSALAIDSLFAPAYAGLGDALAQKANRFGRDLPLLDSAMAVCERAIELDPELSEAYKAKGLVLHYQEKYDEAMDANLQSLKYNPSNGMATLNLASIYSMNGEMVNAIRWARKALDLNPKDKWTQVGLAKMYMTVGMHDEAIELLTDCLQLYPDFRTAHEMLFGIYLQLGNLGKAKEYARECDKHAPEATCETRLLVILELSKGNLRQARKLLEEAGVPERYATQKDYETDWDAQLAYAFTLRKLHDPKAYDIIRDLRARFARLGLKKDNSEYYFMNCLLDAVEGENESALDYLQQAAAYNWLDYGGAQASPFFSDLRTNPRFFEILQSVQTRVDRMRREIELTEEG